MKLYLWQLRAKSHKMSGQAANPTQQLVPTQDDAPDFLTTGTGNFDRASNVQTIYYRQWKYWEILGKNRCSFACVGIDSNPNSTPSDFACESRIGLGLPPLSKIQPVWNRSPKAAPCVQYRVWFFDVFWGISSPGPGPDTTMAKRTMSCRGAIWNTEREELLLRKVI